MAYSVQNITLHDLSNNYNLEFLGSMSPGAPNEWYSKGKYDDLKNSIIASPCDYVEYASLNTRMNSEYFPTNKTGFRLVATQTTSGSTTPILGERNVNDYSYKFVVWTNANKYAINFGNVDTGYISAATATTNVPFVFEMTKDAGTGNMLLKFNGTTVRTITPSQIGTFTSDIPICIGTHYTSASLNADSRYLAGFRIHELDLTEDGVIVRKYRPFRIGNKGILVDILNENCLFPFNGLYSLIPGPQSPQ